ncbi:hypothetical protein KP509_01G078300 [Ceratopteris richardii]|uniref:Uncharacterized protein n=1 Tax=Ceratopteris richardii TaxID=49495 RepID=A0A8T2VQX3_CERRI|nr:hypothetical protein KP509_01G078300 [Ceratopteris richardii]
MFLAIFLLSSSLIIKCLLVFQNQEKAALCSAISECLDFGEERFSIGSWEKKDLVSRDGNMKLSTNVFFASIDQRSERAAGESACTVLVAVIADWLHKNPNCMPIKAEFDTLIREGSTEWRKLCDDETYRTKFFDGHFDLDTVMNARIRPLAVDHARSFVGFFQPEGLDETYKDVLQGHKYFDDIWSAIEQNAILQPDESFQPAIYVVSWNDHFFILKVCKEAYYIMDTLGERLYEGCKQAYAIRFDSETSLYYLPHSKVEDAKNNQSSPGSAIINRQIAPDSSASKTQSFPDGCSSKGQESSVAALIDIEINEARDNIAASLTNKEEGIEKVQGSEQENHKTEYKAKNIAASSTKNEEGVEKLQGSEYENHKTEYKAKDACREFLKGFFAALPIRELQTDLKKGLVGENALHQRLQIEFNFTYLEHYKQ